MKKIGIDTGGTFTDFLLQDEEGYLHLHKVLSTPHAPEIAIMQGLRDLGVDTKNLLITHGSTVATNAVLEGKGVKTVYITNKGFADVLSIGRQAREELYNLTPIKKPPLMPPELCLEVDSRLSASGEYLATLDENKLHALIQQLESIGPKAVAINLLFSFMDDTEECKIEAAIKNHFGELIFISRSSDVLPEYKEFERGMTTTLNALVGPLMQGYLNRLGEQTRGASLSIMQSSGGTTSAVYAGRYPVNLLLSGPAGGLKGAQCVAASSGIEKILTFDMGGTSTDVSIIDKYIGFTTQAKIGGYPVAVPMVDMHTIGAGGGSIASVDPGGMLLVGPESAGASPGPACYGNGGKLATVTDANVVLGRLLPEAFLGGQMQLDKNAAITAVQTIADTLDISVKQAAEGIINIVNDHMVRALRVMSVQRGEDPRDYTLVSFGGAGGLHVCALAEELEMTKALVPVNAGVLSALGMLSAQPTRERSRTINALIKESDESYISRAFEELANHAREELLNHFPEGLDKDEASLSTELSTDLRYRGQSNTLNLPYMEFDQLEKAFHQKHKKSYGHDLTIDVELVNLRAHVFVKQKVFELPAWVSVPQRLEIDGSVDVVDRMTLNIGQKIKGPALITETSSTTWLAKHWVATVDEVGNLALYKD